MTSHSKGYLVSRPSSASFVESSEVEMLLEHGAIIVDVREHFERRSGYICGATHIPLLKLRPTAFLTRRAIITVCRSGHRSAIAARRLRAVGLDARSLAGGMNTWRKAGLPICASNGISEVQ